MKAILGLLILINFVSAQASNSSTLRFRPYNRIGDVAKVTLIDLVDSDLVDREYKNILKNVVLGDAPRLGEQRVYSSKVIAEALRGQLSSKDLSIQIPNQIVVQNRGYELDEESIQTELIDAWKSLCEGCKIRIKSLKLPTLPASLRDRVWKYEPITKLPRGNFSQKIILTAQDGHEQFYWINGEMQVEKKVPVLNRSTPIHTRFQRDDFKFEWRDVTLATDTHPSEVEIVGQQARFTMNANDIIWRNSLVREKAVQRGEIVKVIVGDDQWQISTQAMTQQDGFVGDTINLKNLQTQKIITGRVVGLGEVEAR